MRVTLKDIAQEAGVSVSMVSYVLNSVFFFFFFFITE